MKPIPGWLTPLCLVILLLPGAAMAQSIKGAVKDSAGHAVPFASVNLRSDVQDAIVAFTTTDTGGKYVLRPPAGAVPGSLTVEVRCIGYKEQTRRLTALPAVIDFTLAVSVSELESVVVRNKRPILRTSGDTMSYKVADFSSAQDRVIGDVIKRLPGISVASDGTISYNNKPISGVYISGDNLLDDRYTIATNSIPYSIVSQIQVIDNHQPIKVLQNKVASNDVALNLDLKNTGKLHLLGQETVGAGLPGNYDVNLNVMAFKNGYKAINYLKGNNTGEDLQRELVSHNADDEQQRIGNDPPATLLSLGAVNDPALARQRYLFDRSGMLNANNLLHLKNDWQLRLNAWYLRDRQQQDYSRQATTFLPGDTIRYIETQHNRSDPRLLHTQFTLNLNREKNYVNEVLLLDDRQAANFSHLNTNGSQVDQTFTDNSRSFSNEWTWIHAVRSNNIFQAYSYVSRLTEPEYRTIGPAYQPALFNHGNAYAQLIQKVDIPTWFANNYISFKMPGDSWTTSFNAGLSIQSQGLTSHLSVLQTDKTLTPQSDSSVNNLSWIRKKYYAGITFDLPGQKLKGSLSLPLALQQVNYSDPGYALHKELTRFYFNPQMFGKFQTGLEDFLTFQYSYRNKSGSITDLYQGYILRDYRTLYANNADLTLRQDHHAEVGYNHRKALRLFFFSINFLFDRLGANNIASSVITNNLIQHIVLPYPNKTTSWTASGFISKYSFPLQSTFSSTLQWQTARSVEIQNGALLPFLATTISLSLGAETKLNDQLGFSYQATGTQTDSRSPAAASVDRLDQLLQQMRVYYNPTADLQFNLSGEHYLTIRKGNAGLKYFFADAWIKYHVRKWRVDWQLTTTNVFDIKTYNALYLTANTLTASRYTLPGRIILLKLMFNF